MKGLLQFLASYDKNDPKTHGKFDLTKTTSRELFKYYVCDDATSEFVGHCMALMPDDKYLDEPAVKMIEACQLYVSSLQRYGGKSPYLYPEYGLGGLPEGFSRLAAVYGGTFMLARDISEIVRGKDGKVIGVISKNPDENNQEKLRLHLSSLGTYVFDNSRCEMVEHVVRSICILKSPIPRLGQEVDSCQIIIPQGQCNRQHDIYITMVGKIFTAPQKANSLLQLVPQSKAISAAQ